jgi:hypothetical protein
MSRYKAIPMTLSFFWLLFSIIPINLFVVFSLDYIISLLGSVLNLNETDEHILLMSVVYGALAVATLTVYYNSVKFWQEIACSFLTMCFLTAALFPLTLKMFPTIEPPYALDFIIITIVSGGLLLIIGQIKKKASFKKSQVHNRRF